MKKLYVVLHNLYKSFKHLQVQGGDDPAAVKQSVEAIQRWLERFDVVVVGPGLGRDECVQQTVRQVSAKKF